MTVDDCLDYDSRLIYRVEKHRLRKIHKDKYMALYDALCGNFKACVWKKNEGGKGYCSMTDAFALRLESKNYNKDKYGIDRDAGFE